MRKLLTAQQFRSLAMRGAPEAKSARVSAFFAAEVKAGDPAKREMQFTISTDSIDRIGDTIDVKGWELDAFKKNPVVLWAHDNESLPVGKATRVWIEDNKLKATAEFTPEGMARFNDTVFDMLKGGFLNAVSVGFMPKDWKFVEDADRRFGIDFLKQELLEFSVVSVPANPEALIENAVNAFKTGGASDEEAQHMIESDLLGDAAKAAAIRRAARARQLELLAFAAR